MALSNRLVPRMTEAEKLSYAHRNLLPYLQLSISRGGAVNLNHLEQLAVSAEKTYWVAKAYKPTPTPETSLVPYLAYLEPRGRNMDRWHENISFLDERVGSEDRDWNGRIDNFLLSQEFNPRSTQKPQVRNPVNRVSSDDSNFKRVNPQNTTRPPINPFLPTPPIGRRNVDSSVLPAFFCLNCKKEGDRRNECPEPKKIFWLRCSTFDVVRPNCPKCSENKAGSQTHLTHLPNDLKLPWISVKETIGGPTTPFGQYQVDQGILDDILILDPFLDGDGIHKHLESGDTSLPETAELFVDPECAFCRIYHDPYRNEKTSLTDSLVQSLRNALLTDAPFRSWALNVSECGYLWTAYEGPGR